MKLNEYNILYTQINNFSFITVLNLNVLQVDHSFQLRIQYELLQ